MRGETHFCRKSPPPTPTFGILRAQAGHSTRPILTRHDRAYIKRTKIIRCNRNIITDKTLLSLQEALAASVKTNKQVKQNNCRLEDAERKNIHLTGTNANTQHSAGEALIKNTHTHTHTPCHLWSFKTDNTSRKQHTHLVTQMKHPPIRPM